MNAETLVDSSVTHNENENCRTNISKVLAGIALLVFALFVGGYGIIGYALFSTWIAFAFQMCTVIVLGIMALGTMALFIRRVKQGSSAFLGLTVVAVFMSVFCLLMACIFDYDERGSHYIRGQNSTLRGGIVYGLPMIQDIYRVQRRYYLDFTFEAEHGGRKTPIRVLAELTLARDSILFDKALFAAHDREDFVENDAKLALIGQINSAVVEKGDTDLDWRGKGATSPTGATWTGKVKIMDESRAERT